MFKVVPFTGLSCLLHEPADPSGRYSLQDNNSARNLCFKLQRYCLQSVPYMTSLKVYYFSRQLWFWWYYGLDSFGKAVFQCKSLLAKNSRHHVANPPFQYCNFTKATQTWKANWYVTCTLEYQVAMHGKCSNKRLINTTLILNMLGSCGGRRVEWPLQRLNGH